jgi:hypothetical protein
VLDVVVVDSVLDVVVVDSVLDVVVVDSVLDVVVVDSVLDVVVVDSVLDVVVVDSVLDVDDSDVVVVGYSVVVVVEHGVVVVVVELPSPPRMITVPWEWGHVVVVVVDVLGGGPSPPCTMIRFPRAPAGAMPNTTSKAPSAMTTAPSGRFGSGA